MKNLLDYILNDVKTKRLGKTEALALIRQVKTTNSHNESDVLHPFLHQNTSDLSNQRFTSTFTGQEFFITDHHINGKKLFPGVSCLEMARAALEKSLGQQAAGKVLHLSNVVWSQPLIVKGSSQQVHIELLVEDKDQLQFEIYTKSDQEETVVHSRGRADLRTVKEAPGLDIENLQSQMNKGIVNADSCYQVFRGIGVHYGLGYQGIREIYQGNHQLLAMLSLPASMCRTLHQFVLHPGLMESIVQLSFWLKWKLPTSKKPESLKPNLPYALDSLEVIDACSKQMIAWIRPCDPPAELNGSQKLDIDLCNEQGSVCVKMRGFSTEIWNPTEDDLNAGDKVGTLLSIPSWQERPVLSEALPQTVVDHRILLCEMETAHTRELEALVPGSHCQTLVSRKPDLASRYTDYAISCLEQVREILQHKPVQSVLIQLLVPASGEASLLAGLTGLFKTAGLENPLLIGQVIQVDPCESSTSLAQKLRANQKAPVESLIRYQGKKRLALTFREQAEPEAIPRPTFKERGVYLITGGLGGLGRLFAGEILAQTRTACVILTGRSDLNAQKESQLKELQATGRQVEYRSVDVSDPAEVGELIASLQSRYGGLDGILHSAGVVLDNFILRKSNEECKHVLLPKVLGTIHLDQATKELDLDFFAMFSSVSGVFGNVGQADYAAANAFLDHFAHYRNQQVALSRRRGKTLSLNWPLWKEGGMGVDAVSQMAMTAATGLVPLQTQTGLQAFYHGLREASSQLLVTEGYLASVRALVLAERTPESGKKTSPDLPSYDPTRLYQKTVAQVKRLFGNVIQLSASRIDEEERLESYGIDSVMITGLNRELATVFGELSKTLFFEYQTLKELTTYLTREHTLACLRWTGLETETSPGEQEKRDAPDVSGFWPVLARLSSSGKGRFQVSGSEPLQEPIAIIGLSGMYPQAETPEQFWENLKQGRNCITEIPANRWSLEGFYEPDRATAIEQGKSYSKWGGFVERFAEFDPLFFRISPQEAFNMDPQERLFLQASWQALEDAGYTRHRLKERYQRQIGVFAGITKTGFNLYGPPLWQQGEQLFPATSFSSVANRLSYFLDIQGPSMPIDTMCSASLTAIHEACEHIQRNECQLALAGGVNLYLHPASYIGLCKQQMLSSGGLCRSFGAGGDGFVPGEGVGVVVLKRLEAAVADADRIHAVIRGSRVNHGGKTNGYTVPNPKAQAALIRQTLERAGLSARQLSYIEAHGTGTALGDPIEMTGLRQAFEADTKAVGFCRIGSVKSNIGHLEAAAGIAGLTKIVLQMKHGQLVPSLHAEQLNPQISFERTPFRINRRLRPWERAVDQGRELGRLAGISSFGAGGANAHVIVEEYIAPATEPVVLPGSKTGASVPIPLSAHTPEQLVQKASDLLRYLENRKEAPDLVSLAYNLQTGREEMEERLGLEVSSLSELKTLLKAVLAGEDEPEGCYRGQVKRHKETLSVFTGDEELREAVEKWIQRRKWSKLLSWWVKGLVLNWDQLYEGFQPSRLSLPTYPFARERYWLPRLKDTGQNGSDLPGRLHPILHRNTSDLTVQRYSSRFTGKEFFLNDHRIQGEIVFPGLGHLEMARAAVTLAAGRLVQERELQLKNVVWSQPLVVNGSFSEVHVGLSEAANGVIQYEIYTEQDATKTLTIHSQGMAEFISGNAAPTLELEQLKAQMTQGVVDAEICYQVFAGMGLAYGASYRNIRKIYRGEQQLLAELHLSPSLESTLNECDLHPCLLNSVLQASIGLVPDFMATSPDRLNFGQPYALDSLKIIGACSKKMVAWIRPSDPPAGPNRFQKLDIDLCNEQGTVCVMMQGFSTQVWDPTGTTLKTDDKMGMLLSAPVWQERPISSDAASQVYAEHHILLCDMESVCARELEGLVPGSRCQTIVAQQPDLASRYTEYAVGCFKRVKEILERKPVQPVLIQLLAPANGESSLLAGLTGLFKTAGLENPHLIGQVIQVDSDKSSASLAQKLKVAQQAPVDSLIRYQGEKRLALALREQTEPKASPRPIFKEGAVYLITGGLGGLGRLFTKEILAQTRTACVVLTGRSGLSVEKESQLKELQATGRQVEYRIVDVSDPTKVEKLIESLQNRYGRLDGILHSAGVVRDNFIIKKSVAEFSQVLAPKVAGALNLDRATQQFPLDFFVVFSSVSGVLGNVGQVDYAAANAFLDHFAHHRNRQVALNWRQGKTLSLNWPLWKEGGMGVDVVNEAAMTAATGLVPLQTSTGLRAFYQGLQGIDSQLLVAEGHLASIRALVQAEHTTTSEKEKPPVVPSYDPDRLSQKTVAQVKRLFGSVIKLSISRIDEEERLEFYGIDSIMITGLNRELSTVFGELSKTLFFEYQTLKDLTDYLIREHTLACLRWTGLETEAPAGGQKERETPDIGVSETWPVLPPLRTARQARFQVSGSDSVRDPIAIIGLSGMYPQAATPEQFWENLKQGRNCVTEIPSERWSLEGFYEPNRAAAVEQGKSYSKWGGFLERYAEFDPLFFSIAPQEAFNMDPQERLFLHASWQALEDAGYTRHRLRERHQRQVGVFAGITKTGFNLYGPPLWQQGERLFPHTSFGSVANRLSYFLDAQGPSMPIDTMCSASLTAIHEACEHIQRHECQLALAGGVNLYLHPASYVALCKQQMLSSDGLCRSFGEGGDGFVPGEGVGVVVLKRLEAAVADGDRIHAVIRGSSVNHGGKTNGYTVPNPTAQAALIRQTLDRAGVNARHLSYIEAHGTGTALGDPIEMTGLCQAFEADTQTAGFCRIGSVKSNIGHLEAAAGIAGLTKIILQMRHGQLAPSLNAEQLNPQIAFDRTPFRINRRLRSWERPVEQGRELGRLAGISSFGAGGANAHVIVEEYTTPATGPIVRSVGRRGSSVPIPLSAHTTEQLMQRASDLLDYLENGKQPPDLVSLAYCLQTGREEMEERLGLEVSSVSELQTLLKGVIAGESDLEGCYWGQVKRHKEVLSVFTGDEELREAVEKWIQRRKWSKVLSWWVKGLVLDWDQLYEKKRPSRLSLPTYPFARERYWLPEPKTPERNGCDQLNALHPILHRNTSDFSEQRYSSRFTGEEFFLNDHRVRGEKVFPGAGYLEMARAAVISATEALSTGKQLQLKNVVWSQPLIVNGSFSEVHIGLSEEPNGAVQYEIYTEDIGNEMTVHSRGTAQLASDKAAPNLRLETLKSQMKRGIVNAETCYHAFAGMGLEYGTGHQGIREIYQGENQLLATLKLPLSVESTLTDYVLHPSLMDGAFQAAIGLVPDLATANLESLSLRLPYALESLQIFGACSREMIAWVRPAKETGTTDVVQKLDIDLCDPHGTVCVKLEGFSTRKWAPTRESLNADEESKTLLSIPLWQERSVLSTSTSPTYADHHILLCELDSVRARELEDLVPGSRCQILMSRKPDLATRYMEYAVGCFERVREILEHKPLQPVLIQLLVPVNSESSLLAGLAGLFKTARLENPHLSGQVIQVELGQSIVGLAHKLKVNRQAPDDSLIRYRGDKRLAFTIKEQTEPEASPWPVFKEQGIYLITGGLGGLGRLFTREILEQTRRACVVLTGRSALDAQKESRFKQLQAAGGQVEYRTLDVSKPVEVAELIESLLKRHGRLNGILHSAGVVQDNFILKKSGEEFNQVLLPKVLGTTHLDQATKELDLDFFAMFSSVSGVFGNVGQTDYATANAFLDHFAHYRNRQVALNRRRGKTLSLNWPLWKEGGMSVDAASEAAMTASTGLVPLAAEAGLRAFSRGLGMTVGQLIVLNGNKNRLRSQLLEPASGRVAVPAPASSQVDEAKSDETQQVASTTLPAFKEQAIDLIKRLLASTLKLPPQRMQADDPMEKYGIDSILAMDLTNQLEKTFGSLPKTLFFEYRTLEELTRYFIDSYGPELQRLLRPQGTAVVEQVSPEPSRSSLPSRQRKRRHFSPLIKPTAGRGLAIAIIGMSGRYPQAEDLGAYWANLLAGRDCITEVPRERWDWRQYYTTDRNRSGAHFSKWGGFITGVAEFDPLFFNISPKEAISMDPQERLFLEQVWMAVEDAGYTRAGLQAETEGELPAQVGVYAGVMHGEYSLFGVEASLRGHRIGLNSGFAGIANRVSYVMNFQGPSLTVDTMCSSSLTAIHLACQDLVLERTGLGIAGGVNVSIHPSKYLMLSAGQFISSRGHCESFGEGGDGYIPGEGVGVVLLKRLADAERDGDRIYGVIRGSAINHGGKTNGYSVPNPRSQQHMIEQALKEAGVPAEAVSYVEAHGTGTKLGDPIEISALTKAFASDSTRTGYCRIGSAKSNIGHCESAAGIAGLSKVLLQMRHHTLVPSLHSSTLNPNIDFEATPFVVNQTVRAWERPVVNGREYPRLAGISSFGAGGSNAHLIVEEYQPDEAVVSDRQERDRFLIPLSARNRDRLREVVGRLLRVVRQAESGELALDLADVSYTLQVGREALEERLGLVVSTLGELSEKLEQVLANRGEVEGVYQGRVKRNQESLSLFAGDEDLQAALSAWIAKGKHTRLLELWVQGVKVDWCDLYGAITPRRVSLPPYPFARERYWIQETGAELEPDDARGFTDRVVVHPLLHQNTSDFAEQRFTSEFTGREFFLSDHQLNGEKIFPGVGYLEMARAAIATASGPSAQEASLQLYNIVWSQPLIVNESSEQVHIRLQVGNKGQIQYEIYTGSDQGEQPVVHSQGLAEFRPDNAVAAIDLQDLQSQMNQGIISAEDCYQTFRTLGIDYGPAHQGVHEIYRGNHQLLARLSLPFSVQQTLNEYVLHPTLMDSALQSAIGLALGFPVSAPAESLDLRLPFSLESIEIFGSCEKEMFVWVRDTDRKLATKSLQKLDIDLCDLQGNIRIKMKGFVTRIVDRKKSRGTLLATPTWKETSLSAEVVPQTYVEHQVIVCDMEHVRAQELEALVPGSRCLALRLKEQRLDSRFTEYAVRSFEMIRELLERKPSGQVLIQILIPATGESSLLAGLEGLLKTVSLENAKISGQIIEIDSTESCRNLAQKLRENKNTPWERRVVYRQEKRLTANWEEAGQMTQNPDLPFKEGGVYLVTGGMGGLGILFAREILKQTRKAAILLTGRSALSSQQASILRELQAGGRQVGYEPMDVSDSEQVNNLLASIQRKHGKLDGIIHCAGMISDNFILKKDSRQFRQVLAPKVSGTVNLDEASRNADLDFFVLFSSLAGVFGNAGQADYATANAFMDCFAHVRAEQVRSKQRTGQTLSLNWPLWREGGMKIDQATEEMMAHSSGMLALETETGLEAFYRGLSLRKEQLVVADGDLRKMRTLFLSKVESAVQPEPGANPHEPITSTDGWIETLRSLLLEMVSELLTLRVEDIDFDTELSEFGFDSVGLTTFTNRLNQKFALELIPTIFFEYPTLEGFMRYLSETYSDQFASVFTTKSNVTAIDPEPVTRQPAINDPVPQRSRFQVQRPFAEPAVQPDDSIAIVGMSGTFPMAENIDVFWENLEKNRDCITEIPGDRWDWKAWYGNPQKETNKTSIKWGGFIAGAGEFDPLFFGISPGEAELMDPQQRLLMTYAYLALEDAGYAPHSLSGSDTGIFVGTGSSGYDRLVAKAGMATEGYSSTGMIPSVGPNRMSYFLNLHGPSEPIETACSSSLVAIHRAIQALELGNCQTAIVGGINTIPTPYAHISFNKAGMLCHDGRCKTFSANANGYVRGEGVGMLILKKLKTAEVAHDHIYAVIRGSAENHGGRANSLTAPNPKAQAEVLKSAYGKASIDPKTVGYIEAHGTGTELGDPIEIEGLKMAFAALSPHAEGSEETVPHCGLGSVKSNIGHLELAAGIAGVIKVILQLKHKTLCKSLHCQEPNPYIKLEDSPFYIVRENTRWPVLKDNLGKEVPRRAGVSSFGFGGVNAHVVLEEYLKTDPDGKRSNSKIEQAGPFVVLLSAKNQDCLRQMVNNLMQFVRRQMPADAPNNDVLDLADLSYTLQVGRDHMEDRLGLIVGSIKELEEKLEAFQKGDKHINGLYQGRVRRVQDSLAVFTVDEDLQRTIDAWVAKGKQAKLLELWVKGLQFNWNRLYEHVKPKRISLPTYPFSHERYWIKQTDSRKATDVSIDPNNVSPIHPLLHENTSDLWEQRFSSRFTGDEFFLKDHLVNGERVLAGVGYLEMARVAVEKSIGKREQEALLRFENIVWSQPLVMKTSSREVHVGLSSVKEGQVHYEIYSETDGANETTVHSRGLVEFTGNKAASQLDIHDLKSRMEQGILTADRCYRILDNLGFNYGVGYRTIQEIYRGQDQMLAKLSLPSSLETTLNEYVLHPSMMDAVVQSSIGLMSDAQFWADDETTPAALEDLSPGLPFTLDALEITGTCSQTMFAWMRYSDAGKATGKIRKLDIDLCDEKGTVCVTMKGFSVRTMDREKQVGTLLASPVWKEKQLPAHHVSQSYAEHRIFFFETPNCEAKKLERLVSGSSCLELRSEEQRIESRYTDYAVRCFELVREMLKETSNGQVLIQILFPLTDEQALYTGLLGLLKTAGLENPKITGQIVLIDPEASHETIADKLRESKNAPFEPVVQYHREKRFVLSWEESETLKKKPNVYFKENGVYLITGGLGCLGILFAKEILEQSCNASIVLAGRSVLSDQKEGILKKLRSLGGQVEYQSCDVARPDQANGLIESIQERYGKLDGIIHCAGVIADNFIIKKSSEEFRQVMAPKVSGAINLDEATRDFNLEFFILFSSGAGALGNIGQADYATANAFMDQFAVYRNKKVKQGERHGQSLSINWPLWMEGGMMIDSERETAITRMTGMVGLQKENGLMALYHALSLGKSQVAVMEGDLTRLRSLYRNGPAIDQAMESVAVEAKTEPDKSAAMPETGPDRSTFQEQASLFFVRLLSSTLKVSASKIEADAPLEKYGIDSIMALRMTNELEKKFGSLSKTLFFEYQTIEELTQFFMKHYETELRRYTSPVEKTSPHMAADREQTIGVSRPPSIRNNRSGRLATWGQTGSPTDTRTSMDVAIIGLSGRYPMARDVSEYWENLQAGKNCVGEIPADRWDWRDYYFEDETREGYHASKWGGFISGVAEFDPLFFNISPKEAERIDPQERLFLEHVWIALEDAGYRRQDLQELKGEELPGQVGVYAGVMWGEYQLFGAEENLKGNRLTVDSSFAGIANRVSYFLNLHGPSMAVDTMCSSSLTAIHLACQDLKHHHIKLGIAGGVNVTIHPNKYLGLSFGRFISSRDRCESFGEGSEGYIPGEGVGVVLLKRLADAEQDRDHIYGVIKGSAINHGGKTNGYRIPNPNAQKAVVERALADSLIPAGNISYIEAHGTGTNLGDPIEITGLTKAFSRATIEKRFCFIGSAKSNIGHCESASGIAALTKVLLQMRYGKIAPSLHSETLNPHIDFENTPFVVNQELRGWQRPVIEGKEIPRIAGISCFGAGGSNAHLIVEEYVPAAEASLTATPAEGDPVVVPLSAKSREQLRQAANNLLIAIARESQTPPAHPTSSHLSGIGLKELAYSLQVGREAMEERLGLVVSSLTELQEKLQGYLEGNEEIEDLFQDCGKNDKESVPAFFKDNDMHSVVNVWIEKRKYAKLLDLWVKGLDIDWSLLWGNEKPGRISLPTYPFAKERYWVPRLPAKTHAALALTTVKQAGLHPLLHRNTSTVFELKFSSTFTGEEFFLADNRLNGFKLLPGMAYPEMAFTACREALGVSRGLENESSDRNLIQSLVLQDMVWSQPIVVNDQPKSVHIALSKAKDDAPSIRFEIYTDPDPVASTQPSTGETDVVSTETVHAQGIAVLKTLAPPETLNLEELKSGMKTDPISPKNSHQMTGLHDLIPGGDQMGIDEIYWGENEALVRISLPSRLERTQYDYQLHPTLLDTALRVAIGLPGTGLNNDTLSDAQGQVTTRPDLSRLGRFIVKTHLPSVVEEITTYGPCASTMWVRIRPIEKGEPFGWAGEQTMDLDLYDEKGNLLIRMQGVTYQSDPEELTEVTIKETVWEFSLNE